MRKTYIDREYDLRHKQAIADKKSSITHDFGFTADTKLTLQQNIRLRRRYVCRSKSLTRADVPSFLLVFFAFSPLTTEQQLNMAEINVSAS